MGFTLVDWSIVVAYLGLAVWLGLRARKYVEDLSGYIVAGRRVKVALGVATLTATEVGTVTFMYYSELGYVSGFACFVIGIISLVAFLIIGKTGFIISGLRRLRVMTIPEFYELRYNRNVRWLGGLVLFIGGVLNMGVFLKFDGIFLSETMGFGPEALTSIMVVMLVIVVAYTILGGMFSVVVTDYMQFVVISLGMLIATIAAFTHVSPAQISAKVFEQFGNAGFDPTSSSQFGWAFIIWVFLSSMAGSALWQPAASKALSATSVEASRKVYLYSALAYAGRAMIPMFWGIAALVYLGKVDNTVAAMPRFLAQTVPTGFLGLIVAAMLAASMSTYSAYLLSWSTVAARDILGGLRREPMSETKTISLIRAFVFGIGVFLLLFGLLYKIPDTAFQYIYITGTMYTAGAFGAVALGLYWKKANVVGAYCALILGAFAPALFLVLEKFRDELPAWLKFAGDVNVTGYLSFVLSLGGMVVGSLLTQKSHPPIVLTPKDEEQD